MSAEQAFPISTIDGSLPSKIGYSLSATFLPDGSGLASGGNQDNTVRLHYLPPRSNPAQAEKCLSEHRAQVTSVSLSRNGQKLVTGDTGGTIHLWDLASTTVVRSLRIPPPENSSLSLSFSGDADLVAACGSKGCVYVWKINVRTTSSPTIILRPGSFKHLSVVFSNGGAAVANHPDTPVLLATVCSDGKARVYSVRCGTSVHEVYTVGGGDTGPVQSIAWFPGYDGRRLLVACKDTIRVATLDSDVSTSRRQTSTCHIPAKRLCEGHTAPINTFCACPSARYIATAARDGPRGHATVRVWNAATGEQVLSPLLVRGGVRQLQFSPQGSGLRLLTIDVNGALNVWYVGVLEVPAEVQGAVVHIGALAKAEEEMAEELELLMSDECARFNQMNMDDKNQVEDHLHDLRVRRGFEAIQRSLDEFQALSEQLFGDFRYSLAASQRRSVAAIETFDKSLANVRAPVDKIENAIEGVKKEQGEAKTQLDAALKNLEKTIACLQKVPDTISKKMEQASASGGNVKKNDKAAQKADQSKKVWGNPSGVPGSDHAAWLPEPAGSGKAKRKSGRNNSLGPASTFPGSSQTADYSSLYGDLEGGLWDEAHNESEAEGF